MLRFLLLVSLAYVLIQVWRFFHNVQKYSQPNYGRPRLSGRMVKDEICQTYLPEEEALKEKSGSKIYYFCSEECRRLFLEARKKQRINRT